MKIIHGLILPFYFLVLINTMEYLKNSKIKSQAKTNTSRLNEIYTLDEVNDLMSNKTVTFMLTFYTPWCLNCNEFLQNIEAVSKYNFTLGVEFFKLDCSKENLNICNELKIKSYPNSKVFIKGEETPYTPNSYDIETLLEYIDKINSEDIIELKSRKQLDKFSKNYGDVSFLLTGVKREDMLFLCYKSLAFKYKPLFYFGYAGLDIQPNPEAKATIELHGLNQDLNINQHVSECEQMEEFVRSNFYPIMKKLTNTYITRLHKNKKILLILVVDRKNTNHINFLNDFTHNIAVYDIQYVYSYMDINEDVELIQFFHVKLERNEPMIIVYNFDMGKYHIEKVSYADNEIIKVKVLIRNLNLDAIKWKSGYFLFDFMSDLGYEISRETLIVFCFVLFAFGIIFIFLIVCLSLEKISQHKKGELHKKKN